MKTTGIAVLSTAALMGAASANAAENLPWTFVELGYLPEIGFDDFNSDAGQIRGSIGFLERGHAQLEWTDGSAEGFFEDADFDGYRLTVGGHKQLGDSTQVMADLTYFDYDIDGGEGLSGYGIGLGLRRAITSAGEVYGQVWYSDGEVEIANAGDFDTKQTFIELGGRYNWTRNLSTGITGFIGGSFFSADGGFFGSSGNLVRIDARWSFGNNGFSDLK
jgi:hypothetical protein